MNNSSGHISISDRIRSLAAAGRSRAEIARLVDRSYQQVRQVLVADEARKQRGSPAHDRKGAPLPGAAAPGMAGQAIDEVDVSDLGANKSAKMRRYASLGFSRAIIAEYLGVRYQFVRNVLVADEARSRQTNQDSVAPGPSTGMNEPVAAAFEAHPIPLPVRLVVDNQGRVQLPHQWAIQPGSVFVARNFRGDVVLMDVSHASEAARVASANSVSDDLIAERRHEAMRDFND